ncbi:MAG: PilZ domain-containing protein [Pseudomonadota bacterium]
MPLSNLAFASDRREHRDEVHHRTKATGPGGAALTLLIVNISPRGLMARCDTAIAVGTQLSLTLGHAPVVAEVRWALAGRIGCEFVAPIAANAYYALLPRLAT